MLIMRAVGGNAEVEFGEGWQRHSRHPDAGHSTSRVNSLRKRVDAADVRRTMAACSK